MDGSDVDLGFPDCCAHCPHVHPVTEVCDHESRGTLVADLAVGEACPVYAEAKTEAMRDLGRTLEP